MVSQQDFSRIKYTLKESSKLSLRIRGNSMLPLMSDNDIIDIMQVEDINQIKRFDIIVFHRRDKLICHYFWRFNKYFNSKESLVIITKPLNPMGLTDFPLSEKDFLGVVTNFRIPYKLKCKIVLYLFFSKYYLR